MKKGKKKKRRGGKEVGTREMEERTGVKEGRGEGRK